MQRDGKIRTTYIIGGLAIIVAGAFAGLTIAADLSEPANEALSRVKDDASPLPNYQGTFVSLGGRGAWRKTVQKQSGFVNAETTATTPLKPAAKNKPEPTQKPVTEPKADCSTQAIVYYADQAPFVFDHAKKGLLYGIRTHTGATRVDDMPGYNSCAIVVHAILKKSGCKWAKRTANAKAMYDMAWKQGWRPSATQKAGCLVAWNSISEGSRPRIGRGTHSDPKKKKGVLFRHLGITTGTWMTIDNTSYFSRPTPGITTRPIRYEEPLYLCPVKKPVDKTSAN